MEEEGELRNGADGLGYLLVRIHVPELSVQKCLQFPRDQLVWDVKQQCLAALPKELKESFNYGLFFPPENGRAGKFLDEERRLGDYPFNGPVGYLELKYKRRVYKIVTLDEKQLKSLHTRANLRRFLDYVQNGQMEKVTKMCSKGLDPNFHCQESGETPLTIATGIKKPAKVIMALVNGGAILDYRTKDGSTALHRAVEHKSLESLKTLLELGASPNYKDNKGLTPLYFTVHPNVDPVFSETLLHDHATTGAADTQGWQEVHQACKHGLLKHLEHLLFYGADMNAHNASGNTPLHVCAVNGQESCARQLLFRGADRQALNYANQTPCQVAVIAGNMELAELIQNYRQEDVVPFRATPSYNPKRRSAIGLLTRAPSLSTLNRPPSPCPSDRSSLPFSSASSSLSDGSVPPEMDTASIVTDKSLGDASDIISDSSGVGTANSDTTNCSISMPGSTVVCIESYSPKDKGHIAIREGELIEVTGATWNCYLEGNVR
uniref:Talin N-terminal F0 domain-containing protein n=1 Tax=Dendroctonus ponderosae TaxID=77166 RepID=A0AAR5QC79_DENPD